jgi:hypothetical protein
MTLKTGKAEYPLPMFVNAWLRQGKDKPGEDVPGGYPSGGPLPQVLDAWRAGGPAIDILAPDVHVPNYAEWCAWYTRPSPPRRLQLFHGVRCPRGRPAIASVRTRRLEPSGGGSNWTLPILAHIYPSMDAGVSAAATNGYALPKPRDVQRRFRTLSAVRELG